MFLRVLPHHVGRRQADDVIQYNGIKIIFAAAKGEKVSAIVDTGATLVTG
jgi:hypothetical protein